jgi:putative ABC transport system permease protein
MSHNSYRAFGAKSFSAAEILQPVALTPPPARSRACLGIPLGLALYQLAGGHVSEASPPVLWLLAVIPGTLIVVAALTAIPARIGANRAVADVLRSE